MSIAGALSNALSGLNANARAAELVSSNVANAMTEGYAPRTLELSTRSLDGSGSGVRVEGVTRHSDDALIGDRRLTDAAIGYSGSLDSFLSGLQDAVGTPDSAGSLSDRIAKFEAALIEAAARPDSDARLSNVLASAENAASHLRATSAHIQSARMDADQTISRQVDLLNTSLKDIQVLNTKIQEAAMRGVDPSGMMDLRQNKIDAISSLVPLKQIPRQHGQIALITSGGALLLDGKAAELEFSPVSTIVPEMTLGGGVLSGLTINGISVPTSGDRSAIAGGSLAAQFEIRDERAVSAQAQLDAVARDLVERFQDPALDSSRAPGSAGLFTDAGAAFNAVDEVALASRIALNTSVDPDQGGALWRLRDGLGAVSPGVSGDSTLLNDMIDALDSARIPASGQFLGAARSMSGLSADFLSIISADRHQAETQLSFSTAQHTTLREMELSKGVDTDAEMQKLMMIEQAYAANAQVISAADGMIQTILGL